MALVFAYSLIGGKLRGGVLTAPMVFLGAGILASPGMFRWSSFEIPENVLHLLSELTLVVVLFTDAARIRIRDLERGYGLPLRLLGVGLPLSITLGTLVGLCVFPGWGFWSVALLAAMLAPTDAALGQAVVSDRAVPVRIRQALNVESGLNDGLCLPLVVFFAVAAGLYTRDQGALVWEYYVVLQLLLGPLAGIAVGLGGGYLLRAARARAWTDKGFTQLGVLALALVSYGLAESIGGNGFLAAFVAGLSLEFAAPRLAVSLSEFAEHEGQFLTLLVFLCFGLQFTGMTLESFSWPVLLYAVLSLTLIRMVPVWISLIGLRLRPPTILFLAWFGPRGLASMIYALLIVSSTPDAASFALFPVVLWTVFLSVLLHGITAGPAARAYARHCKRLDEKHAPEHAPVIELPVRHGVFDKT